MGSNDEDMTDFSDQSTAIGELLRTGLETNLSLNDVQYPPTFENKSLYVTRKEQ